MREIKFRAWDPIQGKMYEVQSVDFFWGLVELQWWEPNAEGRETHKHRTESIPGEVCHVDEELVGVICPVLMQCTGMEDANDTPIFEGDIVSFTIFDHNGSDTQYKGVVKWENAMFEIWRDSESKYYETDGSFVLAWAHAQDDGFEVIGNIYQNPELIEASNAK